ncbi:hypothetical protein HYE82_09320 [Streptomyces sp. BR123]|uniref:hypothetical protein n=1 Tax=Streptomyces sp. BR123 TaxID=2749828 RepID=UPI0015C4B327|nr:hypothetical protein [Streptomyces sp. BR123]NXY94588.1 hypothetical protein [Streptomyces sp. BR123]
MPRKAPAQVRRDLQRIPRPPHGGRAIPGISGTFLAGIGRVERRLYEPGATHAAWLGWRELAHGPGPRFVYPDFRMHYPCCEPPWGGDHRQVLEDIGRALPPGAARQLRAVLTPLDERFLARTLPDPYAAPGDPWWRRRLESP